MKIYIRSERVIYKFLEQSKAEEFNILAYYSFGEYLKDCVNL